MQTVNFSITSKELQKSFNTEKYVAIAFQQPKGIKMRDMVEDHWSEWASIVAEAPWRGYWKKSVYIRQPSVTPSGAAYVDEGCGNVPLAIYTTAVWGFGVEGWLKKQGRAANSPIREIIRLQGVREPKVIGQRKSMWDDKLQRGCGIILPAEFGWLDRWLEPMWAHLQ